MRILGTHMRNDVWTVNLARQAEKQCSKRREKGMARARVEAISRGRYRRGKSDVVEITYTPFHNHLPLLCQSRPITLPSATLFSNLSRDLLHVTMFPSRSMAFEVL